MRINHKAVVEKAIATIHGVTLVSGYRRQGNSPIGTLVFRNIDTCMIAIGIDASGIDDIGVAGSDGNIKHRIGLGQQGIALQVATITGMAHKMVDIFTNIQLAINGGNDGVVFGGLYLAGNAFDGDAPSLTFIV